MKLGDFTLQLLSAGRFRLDGGTLFGLVPKTLWGKLIEVDSKNRMEIGMNCLLIERENEKILVETGFGDKLTPKKKAIYGLEGENILAESLSRIGLKETDITGVILSHLHLDHCGGSTKFHGKDIHRMASPIVPVFENAFYYIQRGEWQRAKSPNELYMASYLKEDFIPLEETGRLKLIDGDTEIIPGVKAVVTKGHTPFHQIVIIESEGESLVFFGDTVPTQWNLRPTYITSYDSVPEETLEVKKKMIRTCIDEKWKVAFYHDPFLGICSLEEKNGEVVAVEIEKVRQ